MKWAKTQTEWDGIWNKWKKRGLDEKSIAKKMSYYVLIADPCSPQDLKEKKFGVWRAFPKLDKDYSSHSVQTRYELFIGGFLYYFENHVKEAGKINRTLYFDWGKINKEAALTIFLKPFYDNPLITETTNTDSDMNSGGNGNGNSNGSDHKQKDHDGLSSKPEEKMLKTAIASPPAETPTDPPPPPPPPPPPRE